MIHKTLLNASEHLFNLSFSETLMLRNYARSKNLDFCTFIGGPESIRDIQEAKNLFANALEFDSIESFFAIYKICSAIDKVFKDKLAEIKKLKVFINISTPNGMDLVENIRDINKPASFENLDFIFNFDRRSIAKSYLNIENDKFDYQQYEDIINPKIYSVAEELTLNNYKTSISGGVTEKSIFSLFDKFKPNFIKTGLFTLYTSDLRIEELLEKIIFFQKSEEKILNLLSNSVYYRYHYINSRHEHLKNYLREK
tara:strand:- start:428 stop:1192 length:765 start_codon:yes stop_codon:yes gene_type:complete